MSFGRPSLQQLIARTEAEFAGRLGIGALLDRGILRPLARMVAGASHLIHGHIEWSARQLIPTTAEMEQLEEWASVWGIFRKPPAQATGLVTFTGAGSSNVPAGTELARGDGVKYVTDSGAPLVAGVVTVAVTAVLGGTAGNAAVGTILSLTTSLNGVNLQATVASDSGLGIVNGSDEETDQALLDRLLQRVQNIRAGGADADYVGWALEVPGVTRAWVKPLWDGEGSVGITFVLDDDPSGSIIPSAGKVTEVADYIAPLRPVTARVVVFAPTPKNLNPAITLTPNNPSVQSTVTAAIDELLRREAVPGDPLFLDHLAEAISNAPGEMHHVLTSPVADVSTLPYEVLVRGTITFS